MDEANRLEQSIAALEAQRAALGNAVVETALTPMRARLAELKAQQEPAGQTRRLATVLFTDIVGSTDLGRQLGDPEEIIEVMDSALKQLAAPVTEYGGHISRFMGDGFKAVFGLPVAAENDPERAVRAGLAILDVTRTYARELAAGRGLTGFTVRVGINTGPVVAGGFSEGQDTIMGLTVNLAARLESAAPPGGLLISHDTYRHVRGLFDVEPQQAVSAKGFANPVPVYLVQRARPRAFRLGRRGVEGVQTRTVGREKELAALQTAYVQAHDRRQTTAVTLAADAGIGKSRLLYEFESWLEAQPEGIYYFKGRAWPQRQNHPYFLLRDVIAARFSILDSDSLAVLRRKLVTGMAAFLPQESEMKAHFLGQWLGYDFAGSPHLLPALHDPEQVKNRASLYLEQLFTAVTQQDPAVLFLEDIHWADAASLAAVADLAWRCPQLPLLIVCLARPSLYEHEPDWGQDLPQHQQLDLQPLDDTAVADLARDLLRQVEPVPEALIEMLVGRAEGNPFYVEELVKMLIDDGVIRTGPRTWQVLPDRLAELRPPATLTGVLQARLDRLASADKSTLQQASVVGRVFRDAAVHRLGDDTRPATFDALQTKELIFPREPAAFTGTAEFIFKHALLRDVTYETVLKRLRRQYHAQVAGWLAEVAGQHDRQDEYAAAIGDHYEQAGQMEASAPWYGRAGRQALAQFNPQTAVNYMNRAVAFAGATEPATRFELLLARENAYDILGQRAEQAADLDSLAELLATEANPTGWAQPTWPALVARRQAAYAETTGNFETAAARAEQAVILASAGNDLGAVAEALAIWGRALWQKGDYHAARQRHQEGISAAQAAGATATAQAAEARNLYGLGVVSMALGDYASGRTYHQQALAIRQHLGDQRGESSSYIGLGALARETGDYAAAQANLEQSLAIMQAIGDRWGIGTNLNNLGAVAADLGDQATARAYYEQARAINEAIGDRLGLVLCLGNLGEAAVEMGDYEAAQAYLQQAGEIAGAIGNRHGEGRHWFEMGCLALARQQPAAAKAYLERALAIHDDLAQHQRQAECHAALAWAALALGDTAAAGTNIEPVLAYLAQSPAFDGAANRMRALRFTWETLQALARVEAGAVLQTAAQLIEAQLARLPDPAQREMYLRQQHQAVIWQAWQARGVTAAGGPEAGGPEKES
jgi:predicted ATPase/class 3 adenylate cyclase